MAVYLSSREGDVASVTGWDPVDPLVLAARQRVQEDSKAYEEAAKVAEAELKDMEAAEQSAWDLGVEMEIERTIFGRLSLYTRTNR